jgi:CelD/BcsL family acetyltransferase involved in cellulose biosynthesis
VSAVLHPCADPRWLRFVQTAPGATIFHHPAWLALIGARYGYPVAACCVLDDDGSIRAGVPVALVCSPLTGRRLVAFPFSDACPPLGAPSRLVALGAALDRLRLAMGLSMEVRGPVAGAPAPWRGARYHQHIVRLAADVGAVERRFRGSNVLWGVRRARREGLVAVLRTDVGALEAFYRLHLATRSRLGAPTQPLGYVRALQRLFAQGLGFVLLVERGGDVASAAVFLHHAGVLTYKYSASDVRARRMQPNNLLLWEAIRWGCENGMAQLDMGRTDLGQEGLRSFKLGWGADEEVLAYTRLGAARPGTAEHGRLGRALAAGLRHTPPAASRVVGEMLYRHAG